MLIYDDSFAAVMTASQREATALGADVYGSEHMLLGLLTTGGPLAEQVWNVDSGLTVDAVREGIERTIVDAPHLRRLGIAVADERPSGDAARPARTPRNRHTPELQASLNSASAKCGQLRKTGQLPREPKVGSSVLWLAVLEPTARASKLVRAMGSDPDTLRAAVLDTLAGPGAPAPSWPTEVRPGPVTRLVHALFNRLSRDA